METPAQFCSVKGMSLERSHLQGGLPGAGQDISTSTQRSERCIRGTSLRESLLLPDRRLV